MANMQKYRPTLFSQRVFVPVPLLFGIRISLLLSFDFSASFGENPSHFATFFVLMVFHWNEIQSGFKRKKVLGLYQEKPIEAKE